GPLNIEGRKQYALIVIDDNSRLHCNIYDRIKTEDVTHSLKETFEKWCKKEGIEVEYTPPCYPQAKGKIERAIRTFNEEFLKMFFYYFRNLLNGLTIIDTTWVSMIILPMYIFQKMLPMLLDNTAGKNF
ncbi:MAG: hypothetical protein H5T45_07690, partial [Thermoplasmatales archaeon]|nr:hypothetical protein [Thermoplasmatales archaeon]